MEEFVIIGFIGVCLILFTSALVYETLALVWDYLPKMRIGRRRVIVVIGSIFAAHMLCIWVYAIAYYLLLHYTQLGGFTGISYEQGLYGTDLLSMMYYSTIAYTSLGFGDIVPIKGFRFLSGTETLNGLILIGWTVSYAFIAMQKYWKLHPHD